MPQKLKSNKSKKSKPALAMQHNPGIAPALDVGVSLDKSKHAFGIGMGIIAEHAFDVGMHSTAKHVNRRILTGTNPSLFYQTDIKTGVLIPMDINNVYKQYGNTLGIQINKGAPKSSFGKNMSFNGFGDGLSKLSKHNGAFTFSTPDGATTYTQNIFDGILNTPDQFLPTLENPSYGFNPIPPPN